VNQHPPVPHFWMDGALMGFRFSSPPVLVSTDWLFFSPSSALSADFSFQGTFCSSLPHAPAPAPNWPAYSNHPHLPTILSAIYLPAHTSNYPAIYPPPTLPICQQSKYLPNSLY
jgi:hypothetical protein